MRRSVEKNALSISSKQSDFIHSYKDVIKNYEDVLEKIKNKDNIDRPSYWGGFKFVPFDFEFWEGHSFRLNKRKKFTKTNNSWKKYFLLK